MEPLLVVQLRRLSRRLWQLRHRPGDLRLRTKVGKQLCALASRAAWITEIPYFEAEQWCEWLDQHIMMEEAEGKRRAIREWRSRLDASEARLTSWVKRREKVWGDLRRPVLKPATVVRERLPVHPVTIVAQATGGLDAEVGIVFFVGRFGCCARLPASPGDLWFRLGVQG